MPYLITNSTQIKEVMETITLDVVDEILDKMLDTLQQSIVDEVYGGYTPIYYERTYEFGLAWKQEKSRIIGRQIGGEISFDPSALIVNESQYQHIQAEKLAELIYSGYAPNWDSATQEIPPRDYWSPFITEVNTNIKGWIKDAYLRRGIRLI